jgi:predicted MFS family arabinose efflux permease
MKGVLRRSAFALMWCGQLVSSVGDWMLLAALPFYVYDLTGSPFATGAMFMAQVAPGLIVAPLAGVWADRLDPKRTMIATDLLRAVVIVSLVTVRSREFVWVIYVVGFVESAISRFAFSTKSAVLPRLISGGQLVTANTLMVLGDNAARLVGPALGGAVLASFGLRAIVALDSLSYLCSALLIAFTRMPSSASIATPDVGVSPALKVVTSVRTEWIAGLRLIGQDSLIIQLFVIGMLGWLADGAVTALIVVFVSDVLRVDAAHFGWLLTARGLGGLIGGLVLGGVASRVEATRLLAIGFGSCGLALIVIVAFPSFLVAMTCFLLIGIPATAWLAAEQSLLQAAVSDMYRGRVFGSYQACVGFALLFGMGVGGAVAQALGVVPILEIASGVYVLAGGMSLFVSRRNTPEYYRKRGHAFVGRSE